MNPKYTGEGHRLALIVDGQEHELNPETLVIKPIYTKKAPDHDGLERHLAEIRRNSLRAFGIPHNQLDNGPEKTKGSGLRGHV